MRIAVTFIFIIYSSIIMTLFFRSYKKDYQELMYAWASVQALALCLFIMVMLYIFRGF